MTSLAVSARFEAIMSWANNLWANTLSTIQLNANDLCVAGGRLTSIWDVSIYKRYIRLVRQVLFPSEAIHYISEFGDATVSSWLHRLRIDVQHLGYLGSPYECIHVRPSAPAKARTSVPR